MIADELKGNLHDAKAFSGVATVFLTQDQAARLIAALEAGEKMAMRFAKFKASMRWGQGDNAALKAWEEATR